MSGVTATKTTNYTYGDSNWKDKLTAYGSTQLTYDAIGNPLTYRGYTLTWQNGRQLASMQLMQMRIEFTYDVDGLRTSKTIPNVDLKHKYYYVGDRLQYETISDSSALWYFYDADGNPSGIRYKGHNGTVNDYYFVCNWRGDVIQIYNASGVLVGSYDYDAWGKVTENATSADTQNITETNPIRYRGYYYDTETRLYYLKSRYYDPAVKRFFNSDDTDVLNVQCDLYDKNLYSYCDNNPTMCKDSDGNIWISVAIGVGSQYAADVIGNLVAGKTGKDIFVPTSSVGDYIAAGVTSLIPGAGLTKVLVRSLISLGIYGIENEIKGTELTIMDYSKKFATDFVFDYGIGKAMNGVSKIINSKLPKNYSSYAGKLYKNSTQITARQIGKKMANSFKLGRSTGRVFEFMFSTIANVMRATR